MKQTPQTRLDHRQSIMNYLADRYDPEKDANLRLGGEIDWHSLERQLDGIDSRASWNSLGQKLEEYSNVGEAPPV